MKKILIFATAVILLTISSICSANSMGDLREPVRLYGVYGGQQSSTRQPRNLPSDRWEYLTSSNNGEEVYCNVRSIEYLADGFLIWVCNYIPQKEHYEHSQLAFKEELEVGLVLHSFTKDKDGRIIRRVPDDVLRSMGWLNVQPNTLLGIVFNKYRRK